MKLLSIKQTLQYDPEADDNRRLDYTVIKVTNAIEPHIDDVLSSDQLSAYCESEDWNVTIT